MIYLDNAATGFPKPESVVSEVNNCIKNYCGNPGRGSHELALASAEKIYECREALSDFFFLGSPERVVFTENATHSINLVIKGLLHRGDHVIISDMEHNSVFRPIYRMAKENGVHFDIFPTHPEERIVDNVKRLIRRNTKLVICTHTPNVSSAILPIAELGELCRNRGVVFALDAAQSAGHLPINMKDMKIDALCLPGHKGLCGIQGCGALCLGEEISLSTLTEGGNGINSLEADMPELSPERYETGTLPTPSIVGLLQGVREVASTGVERIHKHELALWQICYEALMRLGGVEVYEPDCAGAVLLFNFNRLPSDRVASELGRAGVCVRGGYHCSALGHKTLKTPPGGAVRVSFGLYNNEQDIDGLADALAHIKRKTE
ncbi:MAG: aminotransferase class V-fold PLP-dependent enzyme [Clostridia bacterium]|nr:aminotransferase class V-fold PLP-dependent enzyme [Clostridia bacterium]